MINQREIVFIECDELCADECTNYWFKVDDDTFALSYSDTDVKLLDSDGCPVDPCNDSDGVRNLLINYMAVELNYEH